MDQEQAANLLFDEYKTLREHFWSSLNRYGLAILTVSAIPYVQPSIAKPLGKLIAFFPVAAFLLSLASTWLLGAEYQRLRMVRERYLELLTSQYEPPKMPRDTWWQRLVAHRIGTTTSVIFGLGFTILSIINLVVLLTIGIGTE